MKQTMTWTTSTPTLGTAGPIVGGTPGGSDGGPIPGPARCRRTADAHDALAGMMRSPSKCDGGFTLLKIAPANGKSWMSSFCMACQPCPFAFSVNHSECGSKSGALPASRLVSPLKISPPKEATSLKRMFPLPAGLRSGFISGPFIEWPDLLRTNAVSCQSSLLRRSKPLGSWRTTTFAR